MANQLRKWAKPNEIEGGNSLYNESSEAAIELHILLGDALICTGGSAERKRQRERRWWFLFKVDCFVPLVLCDWAIASPNNRDLELVMRTRKRRRKNGAAQVVVVPAIASSKNSRRCCWSPTRTNESGVRWTLLCLDGSVHSDEEWNGGKFVYHEIAISCQFETNDAGKWQHHNHNLYRPPARQHIAKRKKWKRNLGQSAV